jgi:hypothetical protein
MKYPNPQVDKCAWVSWESLNLVPANIKDLERGHFGDLGGKDNGVSSGSGSYQMKHTYNIRKSGKSVGSEIEIPKSVQRVEVWWEFS